MNDDADRLIAGLVGFVLGILSTITLAWWICT